MYRQLLGIVEIFFSGAVERLFEVFLCFIACHGEVLQQVVAAVALGGTRYFALIIGYKVESALHEGQYVTTGEIALYDEVVAREASHRSPIYDAVFPLCIVAQIGGSQVLYRVNCSLMECWLAIGKLHSHIEGGHYFCAHLVLAAHVDAAMKACMEREGDYS